MRFKDKVAVVTGASRGIGRAIALELGREGASVVVNYRSNAEAAQEVVEAIRAAGGQAEAFQADVGDYAQAERSSSSPSTPSAACTSWSTTPASPAMASSW